jgi:hypothetical protein
LCNEHGFGGSGENCGGNDSHLGQIKVFYHEAMVGKCCHNCDADNLVSHTRGQKLGQRPLQKG